MAIATGINIDPAIPHHRIMHLDALLPQDMLPTPMTRHLK
jgi:hypothetical protein